MKVAFIPFHGQLRREFVRKVLQEWYQIKFDVLPPTLWFPITKSSGENVIFSFPKYIPGIL